MKTIMMRHIRRILLVAAVFGFASLMEGVSQASDRNGHPNWNRYRSSSQHRHYDHSRNGYWDRNGNYHRYGYRNSERGHWRYNQGIRFWINI